MTRHVISTKWVRLVATVALATPVALALGSGSGNAALPLGTDAELTRFEIDGDAIPGVSSNGVPLNAFVNGDWGLVEADFGYGPQPIGSDATQPAPAGHGSTGVLPPFFDQSRTDDFPIVNPAPNPQYPTVPGSTQFCPTGEDDNWEGGTKVQSLINIDNPLLGPGDTLNLGCGQTLDKGNLFRAYTAYEVVAIPNIYGDPLSGSQNHTVLYGAWERGDVPGELNFYIPVSDSTPGNSAGDRLIAFDYDSSNPATFRILSWDGSAWVVTTTGTAGDSTFQAAVGFTDGTAFPTNGRPSFGEFALDLTASGVLPNTEDGACVALTTAGYIFTETGNSASAQLKDFVGAPRLPIGNCGEFDVIKAGPAHAAFAPEFGYRAEQEDLEAIFPTVTMPAGQTYNRIDDLIQIGETDRWTDVFAQPDYLVFEPDPLVTNPPTPGWSQTMVQCTYVDAFSPGFPVVTDQVLFNGTTHVIGEYLQVQSQAFLTLAGHGTLDPASGLYSGFVPSCTITNEAAGIIIEKAGAGDPNQLFGFDANGQTADLAIGDLTFIAFDEGTPVTILENPLVGADPAWDLTSIECFNEGTIDPFTTGDPAIGEVTIATGGPANTIRCVFTNVQRGSITIEKDAIPDLLQPFTFDTAMSPSGNFQLADGEVITFADLTPGAYSVDEAELLGWNLTELDCTSGLGTSQIATDLGTGVADITLAAGDAVSCLYTNTAIPGELVIAKTTEGGDGDFTFALAAAEGPPMEIVVSTTDGSGSELVTGLVPGTTYTVIELDPGERWIPGDLFCSVVHAGGGAEVYDAAGFTVVPGDAISCGMTNTEQGVIVVDKVTLPADDTTAFDFTLGGAASDTFTVTGPEAPYTTGLVPPGTYTVTELAEADWVFQGAVCDNEAATADGNVATIDLAPGAVVTCTFTNARRGPLTITKTVTDGPTRTAVDTYDLTYQVVITSQSHVDELYDLVDEVLFGDGITVMSAIATGPAGVTLEADWNGTTLTVLVDDATITPLGTHEFTISATGMVDLLSTEESRNCVLGVDETGTGFLNDATVTWLDGSASDDACEETPDPDVADLAIIKTASVTTTGPDGSFDWILDITNNGPAQAVNVVVGDLVPTTLTVTGVTSSEFVCSHIGNTVTCTKATMAVDETGQVTIAVDVPGTAVSGSVTNIGTVESDTPDPDLTNNSDDAKVDIVKQLAPTTTTTLVLPATGSGSTDPLVTTAAWLTMLGAAVVLIALRRRSNLLETG